jgi:hypothetical protein
MQRSISAALVIGLSVALSRGIIGYAGQGAQLRTGTEDFVLSIRDAVKPLRDGAVELGKMWGVPISYEDVAWAAESDLMLASQHPYYQALGVNPASTVKIPKGGSIELHFAKDASTLNPVESHLTILRNLVAAHNANLNPGEFQVIDLAESGFSIVPLRAKNKDGVLEAHHSPLDARISFPVAQRDGSTTMELIASTVSTVSGANVFYVEATGDATQFFRSVFVKLGADNETARTVLANALRDLRYGFDPNNPGLIQKYSWHLAYDLDGRYYVLGLVPVYEEVPGPRVSSIPQLRPVMWPR